ncbi:MAG: hypothetical protein U0894_10060 [Pirellulales bacterium]
MPSRWPLRGGSSCSRPPGLWLALAGMAAQQARGEEGNSHLREASR